MSVKEQDMSEQQAKSEHNHHDQEENNSSSHFLTDAVSNVVNPVIHCVDIEGVSRRVDVEELSRRIDIQDVLERIDVSRLVRRIDMMHDVVDRIDWNEILLERVDLNRVMDRIDVERVVHRSNLHAIVAQSTNSIVSNMLDILRAQVIGFDLVVHDVFRWFRCPRQQRWSLPPKPSQCYNHIKRNKKKDVITPKSPRRAADLAVAARGRCAGIISRLLAYLIDFAIVFAVFVIWLLILSEIVQAIQDNENIAYDKSSLVGFSSFFLLFFLYESLLVSAANRTIGKAALGLLIVNRQGRAQRCHFGLFRSMLKSFPLTIIGTLVALFRVDRRGAIDLVVCSNVIYAWDAEGFRNREQLMDEGERLNDIHSEDGDDSAVENNDNEALQLRDRSV